MKKLLIATICATVALQLVGCNTNDAEASASGNNIIQGAQTSEGIENTENSEVAEFEISEDEFELTFERFKYSYLQQFSEETVNSEDFTLILEELVVEQLILEKVLENLAKENGLEITDDEVELMFENSKSSFETEEAFNKYIEDNKFTVDTIKEDIKRQLLIERQMFEMMTSVDAMQPTEEELKDVFDNNPDKYTTIRASHILVETIDEAISIKSELYNGGDFAELAKKYSTDSSASAGGDLGFFGKGMMVAEFETAAFALEVGEISEPVQSQFGFHLIHLTDKAASYETVDRTVLTDDYKAKVYSDMMIDIVDNTNVEMSDDLQEIRDRALQ